MSDLWAMLKNGWWGESPFSDRLMIVAPAHPDNYYSGAGRHELRVCDPIALFWHEPQEKADNTESTINWFQNPAADASTTYYGDNDGDRYQCVPVNRAPIANGWTGDLPIPRFNDGGPEFGRESLNTRSHSSEEEGMTATIHLTYTEAQWQSAVDLAALFLIMYELPRNPMRVGLAHADVASNRSDGVWIARSSGVPQEAVRRVLKLEEEVRNHGIQIIGHAQRLNTAETENEVRKGEIQQMFGTIFGNPFGDPTGVIPRLDELEKP